MEDRQGELSLAESLYRQAASANPNHAGALNDLGLCLARQGQLDASIQIIEQAIQLQPQKPLYRNNAATILVEMRQDQRALSHLAAVNGVAEANYNLGQLLVQRGRPGDAAPYFVTALEYNPELQAAQMALGQLQGQAPVVPGVASQPEFTSGANLPDVGPAAGPQEPTQVGPQLGYPATATSPEFGTSSFAPPQYQRPFGAMHPAGHPRIGARPVYPHSVPNQPAAVRR
jgi:tetratricopeptide (TPR) repeat protein